MDNYTFRLKPDDDIFDSIEWFVRKRKSRLDVCRAALEV